MSETGVALDTHTDFLSSGALADIGRQVESLGFESVWLPDAMGREPFLAAGFLLASTRTLRIGTGIANVYGRDAMTAAQTRQTLSEMYPGRFLMGLGVSNQQINAMRGAAWVPPVRKMVAYLKGATETTVSSAAAAALAPIYVAAHAPQLQKVGATLADGIMTWTMPAPHIARSRRHIGPTAHITAQLPCVLTEDPGEGRAIGRQYLGLWLALPHYRTAWAEAGFEESDFADGGSDRLIDAIVAWGGAAKIAAHIRSYHTAGATRVTVEPIGRGVPTAENAITNALKGDSFVVARWDALAPIAAALWPKN